MNTSYQPGENFYKRAVGNGRRTNEQELYDLHHLIKECIYRSSEKKDNNKIGNMYDSLMNAENKINTFAEVRTVLEKIDRTANTPEGLVTMMAELNKLGVPGLLNVDVKRINKDNPWDVYVEQGFHNDIPIHSIIKLLQDEKTNIVGAVSINRIDALSTELQALGRDIPAENKLGFGQHIVKEKFVKMSIENLIKTNANLWTPYFAAHQLPKEINIYVQPVVIDKTTRLLNKYSLEEWKVYLKLSYAYKYLNILKLQAQKLPPYITNSDQAVDIIEENFGNDLGRLCFGKNMNMDEIMSITANIFRTYEDSIKSWQWMTEGTKKLLINKLSNIKVEIAGGDLTDPEGYSSIPIVLDNPLLNATKLNKFIYSYNMNKIGTRGEYIWEESFRNPNNAEFLVDHNTIIINMERLRRKFTTGDNASNYGGFGFTLAHEITHVIFEYSADKYGWTNASDKTEFDNKMVNKLRVQYSSIRTINEDVADTLGFHMARKAFQRYLNTHPKLTDSKEEMSDLEIFYYSFAQGFTDLYAYTDDSHSTSEVRINEVLKNQDEFYQIFPVKEGDKMYLPPDKRIKFSDF